MKGRRQEIEHIERMKNAELDLFKDKIADEVVGKMKKVKKVGAIKVVHGGGHNRSFAPTRGSLFGDEIMAHKRYDIDKHILLQ